MARLLRRGATSQAVLHSPAITGTPTGITAAHITSGVLPVGVTGGSGLDAVSAGLYTSIAIVFQQEAYNTASGTFTSGAARIRTLNTEIDADGIVSLSSDQFTLGAGTYTIEWNAPAHSCDQTASWLYNVTDASIVAWSQFGGAAKFNDAASQHNSNGYSVVTIGGSKAFEIRHRCQTTQATNGFGLPGTNAGDGAFTGKYTVVTILKHV